MYATLKWFHEICKQYDHDDYNFLSAVSQRRHNLSLTPFFRFHKHVTWINFKNWPSELEFEPLYKILNSKWFIPLSPLYKHSQLKYKCTSNKVIIILLTISRAIISEVIVKALSMSISMFFRSKYGTTSIWTFNTFSVFLEKK